MTGMVPGPQSIRQNAALPQIPHNRLTFGEEEVRAAVETVRSGYWVGGPRLLALEEELSVLFGASHAVGVGSGLAGLRLALKALGVGPGDRLLVPGYSCVALANAVLALGAEPVPVDVRTSDWNIDPTAAKQAASAGVRAAIAVNTFGAPAPVEHLKDLGIVVVEDCAHGFALGADGRPAPLRGDVAVFSFYATKLIAGGEGGAVLTDRKDVAALVRDWRDYNDRRPDATRLNDKMTDIEAALVRCQLQRLGMLIEARADLAHRYRKRLESVADATGAFRLPLVDRHRVWYRYVIELCGPAPQRIIEGLERRGVQATRPVTEWIPSGATAYPSVNRAFASLVSLPLYPSLQRDEQDAVCAAFVATIEELSHEWAKP